MGRAGGRNVGLKARSAGDRRGSLSDYFIYGFIRSEIHIALQCRATGFSHCVQERLLIATARLDEILSRGAAWSASRGLWCEGVETRVQIPRIQLQGGAPGVAPILG